MAAAKAPDLAGMTRFGEVLHATMSQEMELHRRYCAGFGIGPEELERTRIAPGTSAYGRYLVSIAHEGSVKEIVAAVLPCEWGYSEIGRHLAATGDTSDGNPYREWIGAYASDEFAALGAWATVLPRRAGPRHLGAGAKAAARGLPDEQPVRVPVLGDGLQQGAVAGLGVRA